MPGTWPVSSWKVDMTDIFNGGAYQQTYAS